MSDSGGVVTEGPLKPLPLAQRRKGLTYVGSGIDYVLRVIDYLGDGVSISDLREFMRRENPRLKESTISVHTSVLRSDLRVVAIDGDRVVPTPLGRRLREDRDPSCLAPHLLTGFVGLDHVVVTLRNGVQLSKKELEARLKTVHPGWTSDFAPGIQVKWLSQFGVIKASEGKFGLTPRGEVWAKLVNWTPEFPPPPIKGQTVLVEVPDDDDQEPEPFEPPSFAQVWNTLSGDKKLRLDKSQVAALHAGLWSHRQRHFAVFAGLSGSGKTSLAHAYAQALAELTGKDDARKRVLVVPVSPGWTDATPLLGYVKPLSESPDYETPAFLELLLRCADSPAQIHVAILDEMNLSHPEQYLAPLLSAMELENKPIVIHNQGSVFDGVPEKLERYPRNLVLIGTVNMDETTHGLSDKVLDRATTLEFWDIDLDQYPRWKDFQLPGPDIERARAVLGRLMLLLEPHRLHFGWRVVHDVLAFLERSHRDGELVGAEALDWVLYAKVLPKLRGHDTSPLRETFRQCQSACKENQLPRCAAKLGELLEGLQSSGSSGFWR